MKISFLGTKGYIKPTSSLHKKYTSTLFTYKKKKVLVDFGENWSLKELKKIHPDAIFITHAHPDHAFGLKEGSPYPVFATKESWENMERFPILKHNILLPYQKVYIGEIAIIPFPVYHSIRCPAVGFRIEAGKCALFYVPDVAWILKREEAFKDLNLYIGDGATIFRNMIRKNKEIFGHATIKQQIGWCRKEGVKKILITHCGSDVVKNKDATEILKKLAYPIEIDIAFDGYSLILH